MLDPVTLHTEALTTACWVGADDGKPVPGWDRGPRVGALARDDDDNKPATPGTIVFERGGPCDFEAEPTRTTMVVDLASV